MSNFQCVLEGYKSQQATQLIIQASRMALAALWSSVMVSKTKFDQKQLGFDSEMVLPRHSQQTSFEALLNAWLHVFFETKAHWSGQSHTHLPLPKKNTISVVNSFEPKRCHHLPSPSIFAGPIWVFSGPKGVTFNLETLAPGTCNAPNIQHFPIAFFAKLRNRQLLIFDFIGWHVWLVSNLKSQKEPKIS